ncbi:hypothetical protein [Lysobacter xanthus]
MRQERLSLRRLRPAAALVPALACSGCSMLGALFEERLIVGVLVVAALAALGFIVSRSARR